MAARTAPSSATAGLPCPNIFAGGVNFHGPYEFVSIQVMEKAMQVVIKISELAAGYND